MVQREKLEKKNFKLCSLNKGWDSSWDRRRSFNEMSSRFTTSQQHKLHISDDPCTKDHDQVLASTSRTEDHSTQDYDLLPRTILTPNFLPPGPKSTNKRQNEPVLVTGVCVSSQEVSGLSSSGRNLWCYCSWNSNCRNGILNCYWEKPLGGGIAPGTPIAGIMLRATGAEITLPASQLSLSESLSEELLEEPSGAYISSLSEFSTASL